LLGPELELIREQLVIQAEQDYNFSCCWIARLLRYPPQPENQSVPPENAVHQQDNDEDDK